MRQPTERLLILRRVEVHGPGSTSLADLLLDTGAAMTMLSPTLVEAAGYDISSASSRQTLVTGNGVVEVPVIRVAELRVSELAVRDLLVSVHEIPEVAHFEGLLGLDFLRHFCTTIDYLNGYLEIRQ
jgi:predicted aspartyl protease